MVLQIRDDENRTTVLYAMVDRSVTSTLTINMAMVNDSGEYVCNASSPDYDDVSTDPINLSVQGNKLPNVLAGSYVWLRCFAHSQLELHVTEFRQQKFIAISNYVA